MSAETAGRVLVGIPASDGIAVGWAVRLDRRALQAPRYHLEDDEVESQLARVDRAIRDSVAQVDRIASRIFEATGGPMHILDAHRLLLTDPLLIEAVRSEVQVGRVNAEWALSKAVRHIRDAFDKIEEDYFRERGDDLDFVAERLLNNLAGVEVEGRQAGAGGGEPDGEGRIVVAHDLSPVDLARLTGEGVLAVLTDAGGHTSHVAIMARALAIPAVVGLRNACEVVGAGDLLVVDGGAGEVIVEPTSRQAAQYRRRRERWLSFEAELLGNRDQPACTQDGVDIGIDGNIELAREAESVAEHGGRGVGLYRTEFLFLGGSEEQAPDEEAQYQAYAEVVRTVAPRATTLRTLDLGGDKVAPLVSVGEAAAGARGLRAIRLCLALPDELFRPQLRAMLRASALGPVRILLPMITDVSELRAARAAIDAVRDELRAEGIPAAKRVPVGVMIEVPAAALIADALATEADFFALGTNDLIQFALAADRGNEHVSDLRNPFHPGVLRLISLTVRAAGDAGIPLSACGEMASDPAALLVLLGLGVRTVSMAPHHIPQAKDVIRGVSLDWCERVAEAALAAATAADAEEAARTALRRRFPDLPRP